MSETRPEDTSWSKKNPERWAPFNRKTGALYDYDYGWYRAGAEEVIWKEVSAPFVAHLEYVECSRGRSSVQFRWKDLEAEFDQNKFYGYGAKYHPMFMSDLSDMLLEFGQIEKTIHGLWKVVKRGANYGIKLVDKLDD